MFKPMYIKTSFTIFTIIALFILAGRPDGWTLPRATRRAIATWCSSGRPIRPEACQCGTGRESAVPWGLYRVKYRHVRG